MFFASIVFIIYISHYHHIAVADWILLPVWTLSFLMPSRTFTSLTVTYHHLLKLATSSKLDVMDHLEMDMFWIFNLVLGLVDLVLMVIRQHESGTRYDTRYAHDAKSCVEYDDSFLRLSVALNFQVEMRLLLELCGNEVALLVCIIVAC